ncbi:MFS-type transporter-like protein 5 [Elsinoe fawcettii]|nr:MFS-type transporter-like protein 5 [Elsinoe fawcettii]
MSVASAGNGASTDHKSDIEKAGDMRAPSPEEGDMAEKSTIGSDDEDEAMKAMRAYGGEPIEIDAATNKRLLRIIDWHLMPIMCVVYGMNYLDKTTISYASIMGLQEDLRLKGDNYQWLGSLFYFGYLAWEYPTSRLLQHLPLGKYSALNIIIWGTILACFSAVSNFAGAVVVRLFLGAFEAAVTPGFALLTSQWYTKHEQGLRTGIWFGFNGWAQIAGGVVAYGIAKGTRENGSSIDPWKIVFLLWGLVTICLGCIFLWVIPDSQLNARWLSKEDRILAIERVRVNQQGIGNKHFKRHQLKEALTDPLTWGYVFYALVANIPNGGISNFFSQLIRSFGFTSEESLLYGTPGGAVEIITLLVCGWAGDRFGQRILVSSSGLLLSMLGMLLIICLPLSDRWGMLAGYYLTQASPCPFVALLSLISTNVAGYTKKTTVAALYLIAYCVGNIIGPQTFRPKDGPRFIPAEITIVVCWGLCLVDLGFIWWWCKRENRRKERERAVEGYVRRRNVEWLDLTDRENVEFVYTL